MLIRKKLLKPLNIRSLIRRRNSIRKKLTKGTFYRRMKTREIRCYTTFTNTTEKNSANKKGYLAYQKLSRLNTKTRKLSDKLKDTYGITVGTDHLQYSESSNAIIKCVNFNRRPIQNCTSVYQMHIITLGIDLIVSRRLFSFIKGFRSSDPIYYSLCNKYEIHLSDKGSDKSNGPQFI